MFFSKLKSGILNACLDNGSACGSMVSMRIEILELCSNKALCLTVRPQRTQVPHTISKKRPYVEITSKNLPERIVMRVKNLGFRDIANTMTS
jgi:hypothetical protein